MKIESVEAHAFGVPSRRTSQDVPWVWGRLTQVFVRIRTEDGLEGIGECFAYGIPKASASVVNETLRPMLEGQDATQIAHLTETMFRKTHLFGRYGICTFAISGVEMALWDLAGKRAGMPLHQLLGGAASDKVPAYASLVRYPEGNEQIATDAKKAMGEGYSMLKLHQSTTESVGMGRKAIGADVPLTVDINCEWSPFEATAMAVALDEHDLLWLEEPVWPPEDFAGLAEVQAASGVPLAAGENACTVNQFRDMAQEGAVTFMQPSVTKVGGIGEFLKVAQLARQSGYELAPHSPYFGPGFVASLHLIAHTAQASWIEKIYFDLEIDLFKNPPAFSDGVYTLPQGPGLGVELDWETLEGFRL